LLVAAANITLAWAEPVVILQATQRREIQSLERGGAEVVEVGALIQGLGVSATSDTSGGSTTLAQQGREVTLFNRKSLASVNGDLRLLSSAAQLEQGRWFVPLDSVARLLEPLLNQPVTWRPAQRVLLIGAVRPPRVSVVSQVGADSARIVLHASEKVPFRVARAEGSVLVTIPVDALDVAFGRERLAGGIVDNIEFRGGRENLFVITVGGRFQDLKSQELEAPSRLVLDFEAAPLATTPARTPTPAPAPRSDEPATKALKTVVIDPGHGGDEVGAQGPGGALEKNVTLALARRLRTAIVSRLGVQAFLTRDSDQFLALDERAAIANGYKADLFVSIHANASRSHGARGSEVYFLSYQATDDESRRIATAEGSLIAPSEVTTVGSDLALVLWEMAQADHLEESSALASRIQEELAAVTGSEGRGVKQAPFRVLVGAAMPAVLVEVAFISHPEEEKLLASEAFQAKVVGAIVQGIASYEREHARRLDPHSSAWRSAP
jgi:N-acetylmuramoyl-L-alanine amidase